MGAQLTLHLGNIPNNYANPNVLNRPGSPTAPPSNQVLENGDNYGWANVGNTGDTAANATVTYYHCTPGGPADKWKYFLNNLDGTATLPVPANDSTGQQATSNGHWAPGSTAHTCMIAVVQAPNDPLPPGFMDPEVAPEIADRHVGQQNLVIVTSVPGATETVRFRAPETPGSTLRVSRGDPAPLAAASTLRLDASSRVSTGFGLAGGLVRDLDAPLPAAAGREFTADNAVRELTVGENEEGFRDLQVSIPADAQPGSHDLLLIESLQGGRVVAGLGVLVQVGGAGGAASYADASSGAAGHGAGGGAGQGQGQGHGQGHGHGQDHAPGQGQGKGQDHAPGQGHGKR